MRLYTVLLYFCKTALHVSDDALIHHQEHKQTVITTSGTMPDVNTVCVCSWWWMRASSETCKAVLQEYNKTVYSLFLLDSYCHWFTMHGPMNVKLRLKFTFRRTVYVWRNIVARSVNICTYSAILIAWYHFTRRERDYGCWKSTVTIKRTHVSM